MSTASALCLTAPLEIGIGCRDLAVMRQFYEKTLGLRFVSEGRAPEPNVRTYRLARSSCTVVRLQTSNGERIKLIAPDNPAPLPEQRPEFIMDQPNACYITLIVADVNAAIQQVREANVTWLTGEERVESRPGLFVAFLRDPEGNVLELVQYDDVASYRQDPV